MKLLGSDRYCAPAILEALEIVKKRREDESHGEEDEETERIINQLNKSSFSYEIFRTDNAYHTWIGEQKFTFHDALRVELITKGCKKYNIIKYI